MFTHTLTMHSFELHVTLLLLHLFYISCTVLAMYPLAMHSVVFKSVSGESTQICWWCCVRIRRWVNLCMWNVTCTFKDVLELKLCTEVHDFRTPDCTLWIHLLCKSIIHDYSGESPWCVFTVVQPHVQCTKVMNPHPEISPRIHNRCLCWLYPMGFDLCTAGTTYPARVM